jgi:hypothetical protein
MGDWELMEFNARLIRAAYPHTGDQPRIKPRPEWFRHASNKHPQTRAAQNAIFTSLPAPIVAKPPALKLSELTPGSLKPRESIIADDRGLTEFNARLSTAVYRHSFDQPGIAQSLGPLPYAMPAPLPEPVVEKPARPASATAYRGPSALRPECICRLEQYYRELPGALIGKIVRPLFGASVVLCLCTALVSVFFLTSSSLMIPSATDPAFAPHPGEIGILNPAWYDRKASRLGDVDGDSGFFDSASSSAGLMPPPAKFIYVTPAQAQQILEFLIKRGIVKVVGASPTVAGDFAMLKGVGITIN